MILHDARRPRARARARTRRGRGPARGGRRPRRMAGRADGRIRGGVPRNPAGGDPRDDPRQPEMFRAARADARQGVSSPTSSFWCRTSIAQRRRRGDRGGQRPRRARAPLRRAPFLAAPISRPLPDYKDKAEKPLDQRLREAARRSASSFTRSWARRASASSASRRWRASWRRWSAADADARRARRASRQGRSRHRNGRRIPRVAGPDGPLLRDGAGRGRRASPPRSRSTTSRRGRTTACRPSPVSIAVALADKLDTLVGFWAIDEKPTGSKDPYALRRAALGVIRIVLENGLQASAWRF